MDKYFDYEAQKEIINQTDKSVYTKIISITKSYFSNYSNNDSTEQNATIASPYINNSANHYATCELNEVCIK